VLERSNGRHAFVALLTSAALAACGSAQPTRGGPRARSGSSATGTSQVATPSPAAPVPAANVGGPASRPVASAPVYVNGAVRYRLPLHDNPVSGFEALRCYSGCRQAATEATYIECLSVCPGFEVTRGFTCGADDGLPNSVCLVSLPPERKRETDPVMVAGMVLGFALILSLPAICSASGSQCYGYPYLWRY
jgi:hypothetical protein